jgi:predicted nucleic acid-binding protein
MAIRLRQVGINKCWIALCAVESDPKEGDIYLDDAIHYALATKFAQDWEMEFADKVLVELMEKEKVRDAKEELEKWLEEIKNGE